MHMPSALARFFKLDANKTTIQREVVGGITTFLTMAYILFVNPSILSATGMDKGALITVTALASCFGTLLVGLWVNVPFAMAPGMGLNAFFAYTLVLGNKVSWETALGVVFLSGVFFLVLTLCGIRERIVNAIPLSLRLAVAAGIGVFITFIGLQNLGLVVDNPATLIGLGTFSKPVFLGLTGLLLIAALEVRRIPGSILIGILATTLLGALFGEVKMPDAILSAPPSIAPLAMKLDIMGALKWSLCGTIFSFMFIDLFDSIGTIVACSYEARIVREDGTIRGVKQMLGADAIATAVGAVLGTSTTTTYIESGSGIAAGARTGLASVVTALLFLGALVFTPIIGVVPAFATAPALIIVGVYMFKSITEIDFTDFEVAVPAFLTIVMMPLAYSISTGLQFGFLSYIVIAVASGKARRINPVMWIIGVLSAADLAISALT
ncbi:MAG: NCS2 family permease [Lentisphaerae bacterium]|jgi:adenine/guanine/hypoxanthine permease|nr:NCS2 family permease [Lentisphaerota bacterium]MBT4815940.1 NCS2 family permease [Lentisphaerota bacterium]MBT5607235.1 NCS2 family permease [Lentisphaerota bacterium]MBT7057345.1 NCS2 family permease [Lentisphaerota bacterium]MBT7842639.1 NCS2 family permease [Lentisphaerota bacterium]